MKGVNVPTSTLLRRLPSLPIMRRAAAESQINEARGKAAMAVEAAEFYKEGIDLLERQLYEPGWQRAIATARVQFSAEGLRQLRAICELYSIKNPLIKRGLSLRAAYVWARGLNITAVSNGTSGTQDVQRVVSEFLTDPSNLSNFTGSQRRVELESGAFGTAGEFYAALFTKPVNGSVQVRTFPADEVTEILCNPEDRNEEWYYRRVWEVTNSRGGYDRRELLYPSLHYRPTTRPARIDGVRVRWDAPTLHAAVNRPDGWLRGIPDSYAAIDWAKAYKIFLEDWATLMRALAQYAYQTNVPGNQASAMRRRLASPDVNARGEVTARVGATAILPPDTALQAINKTGASFDSESGRPLAAMVAAALEVPVTMLLADPGASGARATAETLDQPTELPMELRQQLWTSIYSSIINYVITESVRAPQGALKGKIVKNGQGADVVQLDDGSDPTVNIEWPSIDKGDVAKLVDSIVKGNSTRVMPPQVVLRLLLQALGVANPEVIIDKMTNADGEFEYPADPLGDPNGPAALARRGGDPADSGAGRMGANDDATGANTGGNPSGATV